jgi:hypothetical protein
MKEEDNHTEDSLMEEMKAYSSFLQKREKESYADIPDGYFKSMQSDVMRKIGAIDQPARGKQPLIFRLGVGIAAAIALFFVARVVIQNDSDHEDILADAPTEQIVDYLGEDLRSNDLDRAYELELITREDLEMIIEESHWSDEIIEPLLEDEEWIDDLLDNI